MMAKRKVLNSLNELDPKDFPIRHKEEGDFITYYSLT